MADNKSESKSKSDGPDNKDPLGTDVGYVGQKVDPRPNEEYSQETDPTTSPGALDAAVDASQARTAELENSGKDK